jgi:NAD(P)-dependent dehydrogenase (short-subunit alcohol dehydrogenase family)
MTSSIDLVPKDDKYPSRLLHSLFVKAPPVSRDFDLTAKSCIIIGGTSGIGYGCARELLTYKLSTIVITGRNKTKGQAAANGLRKLSPDADVQLWDIEFSSYNSIRAFVARCESSLKTIDYIIISAGEVLPKCQINPDTGFEAMFQTNYMSTVLLTTLLVPVLKSKRATA